MLSGDRTRPAAEETSSGRVCFPRKTQFRYIFCGAAPRQCFARRATLCYEFKVLGNNQDTHEEEKPAKGPPPRKKWLRRFKIGFLSVVLLLALFHRPIFFAGTRYFVLQAAKEQNLDLTYEMRGSIFTNLSVVNLRATPTKSGPIQRLEIGTLNLSYSLWDLVRDGLPAFLQQVDLRDVFIELTPEKPRPAAKETAPQAFKFPVLFPSLLNLVNVNLVIHGPEGDTVLEGLSFSLLPDRSGSLKIQTLDIPGVRRWTDIAAATTYQDRNLVLSDLFVGKEIALRELNLDLTDLEKHRLGVALNGSFFEAPIQITCEITDLHAANHLTMKVAASGLVFASVWDYLNMPAPFLGELEQLDATFEGAIDRPAGWQGTVRASLKELSIGGQALGQVAFEANALDGQVHLTLRETFDDKNSLSLEATGKLPDTLAGFVHTKAEGHLDLQIPEAGRLALPEPLTGDLTVKGTFTTADGLLRTDLKVTSRTLAAAEAELTDTNFSLQLEKDLSQTEEAPAFQSLTTTWEGTIKNVRFRDYAVEEVQFQASSREARVTLEELTLTKESNTARIGAEYLLPADGKSWSGQPLQTKFTVVAPNLSAFVIPGSTTKLQGKLSIKGEATVRNGLVNGNFDLEGREIEALGVPVESAEIKVIASDNHAQISSLQILFNDKNHIAGSGKIQWGDTLAYQGALDINLSDVAIFQPLLGGPDRPALGGALTVFWKGEGSTATPQHSGSVNLDLSKGQFEDQKNLTAHASASYAQDHVSIPDFFVSSDLGQAVFSLFWKDDQLKVTHLAVRQKKVALMEGSLDLPLRLSGWKEPSQLIPADAPLRLTLKSRKVSLPAVLPAEDKEPPLLGTVDLDVDLQGSLRNLQGQLTLRAKGLQSPTATQFAPGTVALDLTLKDNLLNLDGTVTQERIQPFRLTGQLPLNPVAILKAGKLPPETPLNLKVQLPRSSLDFLSSVIAPIRQSRGFAAMEVTAAGTLAEPVLEGSVTINLQTLRFSDSMLPPLDNFDLRLAFTPGQMTLTRCAGGIAGGTFGLSGKANFATFANPDLDLRFRCKNALVLQNDAMTVRVSSDLAINGPLQGGTVKGFVNITRSRFFKNIDILPIGLPGRPAPQPPEEFSTVTFPNPPLRDWKFDVAIRTADPFLVQGNLANGRIRANLQLGGTGLAPWMDGKILIENLTASLPFSRLNIHSGEIFFDRQRPFVPQFNLDATSNIRDYRINIALAGPITDPQTFFTSEPPLTQAAVVSLIATGLTPQELGSNPTALAGQATMLLFQQLYHRVFRRNQRPNSNQSFLEQVRFDLGVTDPKTGRQSTMVGVPLTKQIMLTGGMDVDGDFQGQIKYLIRFK